MPLLLRWPQNIALALPTMFLFGMVLGLVGCVFVGKCEKGPHWGQHGHEWEDR